MLLVTKIWEQRKLNSIFETVSKKGFSNLPVLTATQTKGMIYRNNSGIDIKFNENTLNNYKLVEPNQFVVHLRSFQGGLAASSLRGIASPAYTVLSFKDNKQEVSFWKEFFRSKKFINSLVKVTYGIRDGRTIKVSDLLDLNYRIPAQNLEQCKVGHLISSINKLLTLYERKLKLLSQVKKYFLDNLFAEKEYPNLRFKGFTDAWEQRKLNSVFETVSKKGFSNLPVLTATQTKGMIYRNNSGIDIKFNENTLNNYKLVEPNQFVVHLRSFQGGLAASSLKGIASPAYTVLRFKDNKQEVSFWKEFFRSKKFINSLVKVTYGIRDGRTIKVSDLLDLKYRIPGQNLEQCKVGHLINFINKLLTLYENKQQHLTEIKKTLLNTMFI
uniref:restriction endonuclease subunit S n=1 Tax=Ligilactobacillus aviarius TaxID=1606 RepID=UPI0007E2E788|nr:restriction endonuclease subunit S [Ligilactobacillus aviarius]